MRSKKFIISAVVVALLLVGTVTGVVLAQDADDGAGKGLLARVAEILGIEQQQVEDAFAQAKAEMKNDALVSYLDNLVAEGEITQAEADAFLTWWQAKPDMEPFQQQLKEWQESMPDFSLPGIRNFRTFTPRVNGNFFWGFR